MNAIQKGFTLVELVVVIVILGFALRLNALVVVAVAGLLTDIARGSTPTGVIEECGRAFNENR